MHCDRCSNTIPSEEARQLNGRTLCEDCYMDALSPTRTCDPWAVHAARSCPTTKAGPGGDLTETQGRILEFLEKTKGAEPAAIVDALGITMADLERDIAALRHMEKLRAELRDGVKFIRLW